MNKDPFLKLQSAKTIEELIDDNAPPHSQNWLLSYLDVFVLMLMLIITLIAISDFAQDETQTTSKTKTAHPVSSHPPKTDVIKKLESRQVTPYRPIEPILPSAPELVDSPEAPVQETEQPDPPPPGLISPTTEALSVPESPEIIQQKTQDLEKSLNEKLTELGLNKAINLKVTEDYTQLEIQDKILFESSQANLMSSGMNLLDELMPLLQETTGLIFIEGHTDNRPINTPQFPSNWELGSARATSVLHFLTTQGLPGERLRAVTYADTVPIADNATEEGREKNRRVNLLIKMQE